MADTASADDATRVLTDVFNLPENTALLVILNGQISGSYVVKSLPQDIAETIVDKANVQTRGTGISFSVKSKAY